MLTAWAAGFPIYFFIFGAHFCGGMQVSYKLLSRLAHVKANEAKRYVNVMWGRSTAGIGRR